MKTSAEPGNSGVRECNERFEEVAMFFFKIFYLIRIAA